MPFACSPDANEVLWPSARAEHVSRRPVSLPCALRRIERHRRTARPRECRCDVGAAQDAPRNDTHIGPQLVCVEAQGPKETSRDVVATVNFSAHTGVVVNRRRSSSTYVSVRVNRHRSSSTYVSVRVNRHRSSSTYVSVRVNRHRSSSTYVSVRVNRHRSSSTYVSVRVNRHRSSST